MAAGRPIVATAVGGIPEVVRDGVGGLLVPADDAAALAAAIGRILADPALAARLAAGARERAAGYDWDRLAERTAAVYETVLGRR
jgi:2-deoxystreptamine N-acetyl-D-glucosaminyltransferase/2-deoxystreptamine glucosyltransferase